MSDIDLSILIPARNEMFLSKTIEDILDKMRGKTEIIAVCDGAWPPIAVPDHPAVTLVYYNTSIGQRAATNMAARMAQGKWLMKMDAHCAVSPNFDVLLMERMEPDMTLIPIMRNLHAFDWVCPDGHRRYQGPSGPCKQCGKPTTMDVVWIGKNSPQSISYRFDRNMHFQYWSEWGYRCQDDLIETMSIQGSCFMVTKERYFALDLCSEQFHSWGQQGVEVACKTWLSGGRCIVYKHNSNGETPWYAHMFRTQGGDFSFPYPNSQNKVLENRELSRQLFEKGQWDGAVRPFSWIIDHFRPPEWIDDKSILYYTCNTHKEDIELACRKQLGRVGLPIISVSLNKDIDFGTTRIRMDGERGAMMMHRQILAGLEASTSTFVYLCESDVLYHPSHFSFIPGRRDVFYYDTNVWRSRYPDGFSVWTDDLQQVSGVCASRDLLIEFYKKRIAQLETEGFNGHYEPGIKQTVFPKMPNGVYGVENWQSETCNICIRHDSNLTKSKWRPEDFRDKKYTRGWKETFVIPGWGRLPEILTGLK